MGLQTQQSRSLRNLWYYSSCVSESVSERSRQQSVSDPGDVILAPPVLSAVAHGLSPPAGVVPVCVPTTEVMLPGGDTGDQTNDTYSHIRQATVHPNVHRDVLDPDVSVSMLSSDQAAEEGTYQSFPNGVVYNSTRVVWAGTVRTL